MDLNIATKLLVDAFDDVYDLALVLSGDSGFLTIGAPARCSAICSGILEAKINKHVIGAL